MLSERHRIEDSPSVAVSAMHSPPSYEDISGVFASQSYNRSADNEDYFLGEVTDLFIAIFLELVKVLALLS